MAGCLSSWVKRSDEYAGKWRAGWEPLLQNQAARHTSSTSRAKSFETVMRYIF
jgi:hypothetical protein